MNVYLDMVGCRLNQAEIEKIAYDLTITGHHVVSFPELADTIIINTCCVTAKACADSRKMIRRYLRDSAARIVITGCWATVFFREAQNLSDTIKVFPNQSKNAILDFIGPCTTAIDQGGQQFVKPSMGNRTRTRSFVKVQEGCNNQCSYCLTRIARGKSRSQTAEEVIKEIQKIEEQSGKEIVLTGVQLGAWGKDLNPKKKLSDLIDSILVNTSIRRIRLSSNYPTDIYGDLLCLWKNPRLCPHLHIPLQSGSDCLLEKMRRPFRSLDFERLFNAIQHQIPEMAITTDVMVGFPGENEGCFEETYRFLQRLSLAGGHVFRFSPMPGTLAVSFPETVPNLISLNRSKKLRQLLGEKKRGQQMGMIGKVVSVLWESYHVLDNQLYFSGFTENYQRVEALVYSDVSNSIRETRIQGIQENGVLLGEILRPDVKI